MYKNPNGYGSVVKLSGNRRKPYTARKTSGWNDKGHPIYLTIGYYATREEAMIALAEYNKNPYDIQSTKMTVEEVFQKFMEIKAPKMPKSSSAVIKSSFKHCKAIYQIPYKDLKSYQMQDVIDNCGRGYSTQGQIKTMFYHLDRFAMELDIISKRNSELITRDVTPDTSKEPFTDEEVQILWDHKDEPFVWTVLVLIYSGWRITEFLTMKTSSIDLEAGTMMGGIKTKAGKDRIVPIHSLIMDIIKQHYDPSCETFIHDDHGNPYSDCVYREKFHNVLGRYGINHTPHECRHTFRSKLDSAGANKRCIDLMMGHKSIDVGERIYTHKTLSELKTELEKILK